MNINQESLYNFFDKLLEYPINQTPSTTHRQIQRYSFIVDTRIFDFLFVVELCCVLPFFKLKTLDSDSKSLVFDFYNIVDPVKIECVFTAEKTKFFYTKKIEEGDTLNVTMLEYGDLSFPLERINIS